MPSGVLSGTMSGLRSLLQLTKIYCEKFQVKLVGCKTTLLVFTTRNTEIIAKIELVDTPITVDGTVIHPTDQAPHVGVIRSVNGNGPNIVARMSAHRGAVYGLLYAGGGAELTERWPGDYLLKNLEIQD
jgi:hypothetical protein